MNSLSASVKGVERKDLDDEVVFEFNNAKVATAPAIATVAIT
jgi:hypothetical protein